MRAIYNEELKELMSCGCGNPGCKDKAEWVTARCHVKKGIKVTFNDGIMDLYCFICGKIVVSLYYDSISPHVDITVETDKTSIRVLPETKCMTKKCLAGSGHTIRYRNDKIEMYCNECKGFISYINLSRRQ